MSEKKRDAGYRAALTGAKGTVRLLIYVCVILVIILAAKTSYQFGHDVFAEEPVSAGHPLLALDNFVATPHLGANTEEALKRVGMAVVQGVLNRLDSNL